jgi:hypothetical protein
MGFRPDPQPSAAPATGRFRPDDPTVKSELVPRKPHDPMNDPPLLPGEAGYDSPEVRPLSEAYEPGIIESISDYAKRVGAAGRKVASTRAELGPLGVDLGPLEAGASMLTGMVAPAIASARGIIGGYEPTNAEIADATYSPRTASGQAQTEFLGELFSPLSESGADVALTGMVPELPTAVPRGPVARAPKPAPMPTEGQQTLANIRKQGIKVTPREASQITGDKNFFGRALQAIGGDTKVSKDIAAANQPVINKMGAKAVGADSLTERGLKPVKDHGNAVYNEMSSIGQLQPTPELSAAIEKARGSATESTKRNTDIDKFVDGVLAEFGGAVDAGQVVNRVRELRRDAQNSRKGEGDKRPTIQQEALGEAQRAVADALDDFLEYNAATAGKPELAKRYKENRVRLAKVGTVEGATRAGNLNAKELYAAKKKGAPLSGKLEEVAVAHEYAPESTSAAAVESLMDAPGRNLSLMDLLLAAPQAAARHMGVNRFLQSDFYQNMIGGREGGPHLAEHDTNPDAWPPRQPAAPAPPSVDFEGELGLVDVPAYESLPSVRDPRPVTGRNLAEDIGLQLVEDAPVNAGPARRVAPDDGIPFELVNPEDVGPYRINTDLNFSDARPLAGVQRGAAMDTGGLELLPDPPPGPYQELPPSPGKPRQGGAPRIRRAAPASPPAQAAAPLDEGLSELGALIDEMLRTPNPRAQAMGMQQQMQGPIVPGTTRVTAYRGVPEGVDPFDTTNTHGNALFYTPDEATARTYGSNVARRDLEFANLLQTPGDTLEAVRQALGLADSAELLDIIAAARGAGYDGVTYDLKPGREYIQIPRTQ